MTTAISEARGGFEPAPPKPLYQPANASVDPDQSKGWIRRLMPVLRPYRLIMGGAIVSSITMLGLQVAIPQVLRGAIDEAVVRRSAPLMPYVWVIVALGCGQMVLGYVQRFGLMRASTEIESHLRTIMFDHFTRMSFSFYDHVQTGQMISRANSDIRSIQMFLAFGPMIATSLLSFVAAMILMLQMHVLLTLVAAAALPFVYQTGLSMRRRLWPISWMMMARAADIATIVEENVTGTRVVKAFAAEPAQVSLFERAARRQRWAAVQQVKNQARYGPVMQNLPRLSSALLLLYGGKLVINGDLTFGAFVAFNSYAVMLQVPFQMMGMLMMMAQRSAASAQRVLEVLDQHPDIVDRPGAVDLVTCEGDVEFDHVDFSYAGHAPILRDFSLHLRPGETVALVGRTGSGKSTVARLIPRFYDLNGGAVRVDGHDVRDLTQTSLRSHIGLVLDDPFLFSESVFDNVAFGRPDASLDDVVDAAKAAGADDFVRALGDGYESIIGERGYTLSGGQRQRLSIARTLLVNPRILILDDATSSIDAQREFEIHEALKTLMRGRTTLIIAHRLSTIGLADRVAVLEEGRVIAQGTHDELIATVPTYAEILAHAAEDDVAHLRAIGAEEEKRHDAAETALAVGLSDPIGGGD
ncbi:MAG TPA: ABC transporter ATP-binding protein [Acidimicrobiales bacterium]|nr:ABC transporter ATP-binding protein [Acidimicrobiales bacterium]